jgi:disulfide oxidoreductase YuzD
MIASNKFVKIFMYPQQFPCGPQSSCCGPIGQTEEEIQLVENAIKKEFNCQIKIINVMDSNEMKNHLQVGRLLGSFGPMALPIITLGDEVVSMGNPLPDEAVSAIKGKLSQD